MDKRITTPITEEITKDLKAGDYVYITGTIYVARDAAHKRMIEALDRGEQLPIEIENATIYYMGPSPAREGRPIGSARSDNSKPDGQICTDTFRPWTKSNDRKRKEDKRSHRSHEKKSCSLLCGNRRGRSTFVKMYHRIRDCLL